MMKSEDEQNPLGPIFLGLAICIAIIAAINAMFVNGAIILFLTILMTLLFKPSMKISMIIIVVSVIALYLEYQTILYNWKVGMEHIINPFADFTSLSSIVSNYEEFENALNNVVKFNLYCLSNLAVWFYSLPVFVPVGLVLTRLYIYFHPDDLKEAYQKNTQKKLKNRKVKQSITKGFVAKINRSQAFKGNSTLIGSSYKNKKVFLRDDELNKHVFVVGPTGSGKTVTICNLVESDLAP